MTYDPITPRFSIHTDLLDLTLETTASRQFSVSRSKGRCRILCPEGRLTESEAMQRWMRDVIREQLRKQAHLLLPERLQMLAGKWGLPFSQLTIRRTSSRWGSCTADRHISLSIYLMLLDAEYIDSVLLHELCHTRQMNHGPQFWALLDSLEGGKARLHARQLRNLTKQWQQTGDPRAQLIMRERPV